MALNCREDRLLTRRRFLATGARGVAAGIAIPHLPGWLPNIVLNPEGVGTRDVIVSIFLRGGADGLTLCAPWADPFYAKARPTLAVPAPDANSPWRSTALDDVFALPPAMTALVPAFRTRDLLLVHAAGQLDDSRSHFDAQKYMEFGETRAASSSGWLGRHLATSAALKQDAPLRGLSLSHGYSRMLLGAPRTLPIDPDGGGLGGPEASLQERSAALRAMYSAEPDPIRTRALDALDVGALMASIDFDHYMPASGVVYPQTDFASNLRTVAALIKADVGVEAAQLDLNGWDTHGGQGPFDGDMFKLMTTLSGAMAAFHADVIAPGDRRVTVVAMSEFGRTLAENGSKGTDHGRATVMLVMGKAIDGGRVLVNHWPGLAPEQLEAGQDLKVTIDYRDVLAEIVSRRLGNDNLSTVFPGLTPKIWHVTR